MSSYMSKLSASLKWDPKMGRIASIIMAAYVGFFYLTKNPVPNFFYSLCSSIIFKVILLAAFVAAVLHRDYVSAGLLAVAYFMMCNLVGRGMWEMMSNMPPSNPTKVLVEEDEESTPEKRAEAAV